MFAVQILDPRGKWIVDRKYWIWSDAYSRGLDLQRDGYEVRLREV